MNTENTKEVETNDATASELKRLLCPKKPCTCEKAFAADKFMDCDGNCWVDPDPDRPIDYL